MPQLIPFYFINQVTFVFLALFVLLYILSIYILPNLLCLLISRNSISKI